MNISLRGLGGIAPVPGRGLRAGYAQFTYRSFRNRRERVIDYHSPKAWERPPDRDQIVVAKCRRATRLPSMFEACNRQFSRTIKVFHDGVSSRVLPRLGGGAR